jgi:ABC-2 type transport system permease protein
VNRILQIALRDFMATVCSRTFIAGVLFVPLIVLAAAFLSPHLFNLNNFQMQGEVAVIDPAGRVAEELKNVTLPGIRLLQLAADADIRQEKSWLLDDKPESRRLAMVVIHPDAAAALRRDREAHAYDLYVAQSLDARAEAVIEKGIQQAIVSARLRLRALDQQSIQTLMSFPSVDPITVTKDFDRKVAPGVNSLLPAAFALLLFIGVAVGGQTLLTSTIEEKSSRVIEVLLSAVSPLELMAGKLLAQLAASLILMASYIAIGLAVLAKYAIAGLVNPWFILYLAVSFVLTYLIFGSVLMAVGSTVNDTREAQALVTPIWVLLFIPYVLSALISLDPNSPFSTAISFVPPISGFSMLLRLTSTAPPPWWQAALSLLVSVGSVLVAMWFSAKIFRVGLLMYGKSPGLATLVRWLRSA